MVKSDRNNHDNIFITMTLIFIMTIVNDKITLRTITSMIMIEIKYFVNVRLMMIIVIVMVMIKKK